MRSCAVPELAKTSLSGDRISLRAALAGDAARLYAYIRDPAVNRFLNVVPPEDFAMFAAHLREMLGGDEVTDLVYVIAEQSSHAALGVIRLLRQGSTDANVSFWLGQEHWGKRFASDAIRAVARHAVRDLGISAFVAQVFGGNVRSANVLGHLGFKLVRTRPLSSKDDLGKRQELTFRLEYAGLKALAEALNAAPAQEFVVVTPEPFDTIHVTQDWGVG